MTLEVFFAIFGQIHFQDDDNAKEAVYVLGQMALLLKSWIDEGSIKAETIYGMELLNEPAGKVALGPTYLHDLDRLAQQGHEGRWGQEQLYTYL